MNNNRYNPFGNFKTLTFSWSLLFTHYPIKRAIIKFLISKYLCQSHVDLLQNQMLTSINSKEKAYHVCHGCVGKNKNKKQTGFLSKASYSLD
jgi:hypothetical protein